MMALNSILLAVVISCALVFGDEDHTHLSQDSDYEHTALNWFHEYRKQVRTERSSDCSLPGRDYPHYASVPPTTFTCDDKRRPGIYADEESGCQSYYVCLETGRREGFVCPETTIFDQKTLICENWAKVNCSDSSSWYGVNSQFWEPRAASTGPITVQTQGDLVVAVRAAVVDALVHMVRNSLVRRRHRGRALFTKDVESIRYPVLTSFVSIE